MLSQKAEKSNIIIHVTKDNGKTGIWSFNLLAGDKSSNYNGCIPNTEAAKEIYSKKNIDIKKVCGTCDGDCPGCYAKKMTRYTGVFVNMVENTKAVLTDLDAVFDLLETELYSGTISPKVFRIHDSGDFFSLEYFSKWCEFIKKHPETKFGAYTKAEKIINEYGIENIPENFSLQCSPWEGHCNPIGNLPQFIYDNGKDPEIAKLPHCPAVDKNGKRTGIKCNECLYCYNAKKGGKRAVYAH